MASPLLVGVTDEKKTFQTIDREIEKHQALIIILKNQRNRIVPISRLPPEVLCYVFYFVSQDTTTSVLQWIRLSYVCHDWRELAINSPSLWTNLPLQYSRWTDEMLVRSKMASLTVVFGTSLYGVGPRKSLHKAILHHMSRIKSLNVTWTPDATESLKSIPRSAPMLESLVMGIHHLYQATSLTANERGTGFRISQDSLCEMAQITRLELTGIHVDWDLHLHNTLTVLKLHYTPGLTLPTVTQFWDALGRLSLLETLDLQDSLPYFTKPSSSREKINFKHLAELRICSMVAEADHLLEGICFPPTTIVSVTCRRSSSSNFAGVFSSVAPRPLNNGGKHIPIRYLDVRFLPSGSNLIFRAFSSVPDCPTKNGFLSLDLSWDKSSCNTGKVLVDLFHVLPLDTVNELRITDYMDQISAPQILETFGSLRQVRKLTVNLGLNYILALQDILPTSNSSGRVEASFPNLQSIFIDEATFSEDTSELGSITAEMLLDCLMWRYEYGAEVQKLDIQDCTRLSEDDVDLFREVVVDVEWDELEMGFSDDEDDEDEDEDDEDMYSSDYDEYEDGDYMGTMYW